MIGVGYACDRPECNGHVVCAAVFMEPAPRSGCGCHNCTQFRAAMKLERVQAKADAAEQVQISRIERRNDRKRAKDTTRPKREPAKRLLHHMMGGYDRKRPGAAA